MTTAEKIEQHKVFWKGQGPSLIFVPPGRDMREVWQVQIYDTRGYKERFYNPERMWEAEMQRARPVLDWPSDGIPTIRPNLGVVFVPSMAGQDYHVQDGQMPWCGEPLGPEQIRASQQVDVVETELMRLAAEFYHIHSARGDGRVAAYQPDTQGIFDIAHLIYGEAIFYDIMDGEKIAWVDELLDICLDLMVRAARHVKKVIGEQDNSMIHGHGAEQGTYFPNAGLRISEDSPTMISPELIDRFVMPRIERCAEEFGGIFMHYCGKHEYFFERLCRCEGVRAIDLGNPEMYGLRWLLERCAETGTVFHSRVAGEDGENWQTYVRRVAGLIQQTGARCILRPLIFPQSREECAAMRDLWHELTA